MGISGGPMCASYLYYIGGFKSSFFFFGISIGLFSFLIHKLEIEESDDYEEGAFFSYLMNPVFYFLIINNNNIDCAVDFLEHCIRFHFENLLFPNAYESS